MSDGNNTFDDSNSSLTVYNDVISKTVRFWFYLVFLIPSFVCSLFVLYHLLVVRALRQAPANHVIFVVLLIGFISEVTLYPWILYYSRYDGVWHRSRMFCAVWDFIDSGLYVTQTILFAWATMQRHILIFHDKWLSTKKKRLFTHYFPLIFLLVYCLIYYMIADFFPPCENYFNDSDMQCFFLCFYDIYPLFMWEMIVHEVLPVLIIVAFSLALCVRVLWQKHRVHQPIKWRKQRRMTIQLLSISFLFLLFFFPLTLMNFMYLCGLPSDTAAELFECLLFSSYYVTLLLPFVCILSLPELRTRFINFLHLGRKKRRITPEILMKRINRKN